jgi:hypothetical protein
LGRGAGGVGDPAVLALVFLSAPSSSRGRRPTCHSRSA